MPAATYRSGALALLTAACGACGAVYNPAGISSGLIGCPADEIDISPEHIRGAAPYYWIAICRGQLFYCSAAAEFASCERELPHENARPAPADAYADDPEATSVSRPDGPDPVDLHESSEPGPSDGPP